MCAVSRYCVLVELRCHLYSIYFDDQKPFDYIPQIGSRLQQYDCNRGVFKYNVCYSACDGSEPWRSKSPFGGEGMELPSKTGFEQPSKIGQTRIY
ncbi:hypothetical protein J6590_105603, partial [Homalodisca vitripennis]